MEGVEEELDKSEEVDTKGRDGGCRRIREKRGSGY